MLTFRSTCRELAGQQEPGKVAIRRTRSIPWHAAHGVSLLDFVSPVIQRSSVTVTRLCRRHQSASMSRGNWARIFKLSLCARTTEPTWHSSWDAVCRLPLCHRHPQCARQVRAGYDRGLPGIRHLTITGIMRGIKLWKRNPRKPYGKGFLAEFPHYKYCL